MRVIRHGDVTLEIDECDGGRAVSWRVGDHELLGASSEHTIDRGMYPMAPWAGRIRGNELSWNGHPFPQSVNFAPWAIHGLVLSEPFDVIEHEPHRIVLQREFGPAWPTAGGIQCSWLLSNSGLTTELRIHADSAAFPAVGGWHPWFLRTVAGVAATWSTDCQELICRGADALPNGDRVALDTATGPFDDAITGGTHVSLDWPGIVQLEIENSHPWFVVYDATESFVCIEPQTGPPDGLADRITPPFLVTPETPLVMRTLWRITRAQQQG